MTGGRAGAVVALHAAVVLALGLAQFVVPAFHQAMLTRIMVLAVYAIGYNVCLGYTGLMSLGHAMFFAAGMYGAGLPVYYLGFAALPAFGIGVAAGATAAAAIGPVALRTTGVAFLIVTMMFGQAVHLTILYLNEITLGDQGFTLSGRLSPISLGTLRLALADPAVKYNLALALFALALAGSLWLVASPIGRVLVAVRENEERARLLGYDTRRYRLFALVVSGALSGSAGAAYALLFSYAGGTFASTLYSIYPLLWTLLGGTGTTLGPLVGTMVMAYVVDVASGLTSSYLLVVGIMLIVLVLWFPTGVVGGLRARWAPWLP